VAPADNIEPVRTDRSGGLDAATAEARWTGLYRVGSAAALTTAILIPIQIAVFLIWPPPLDGTAADWFELFRDNRLVALVDLDLLLVVDNVLLIPLLLAFYVALNRLAHSAMVIAAVLGLFGVAMYVASNPAIGMARLSDQYAAATTDGRRSAAVAAGEALLANWQGTAFHAAYLLGAIAGILIGLVMLRAAAFGKVTGWMAILGNAVGLGLYLPAVGVYIAVFSVLFLEIWYLLVARKLYLLGARPRSGAEFPVAEDLRPLP
jgi:hypothetical protein